MSNIDTKDLEKLSAYLDGELTGTEKTYIENKLQQSPTLRQELTGLRYAKESVNAVSPLPPDAYFETRLMQKLSIHQHGFSSFFLNRKPIVALASVTLLFLIVFKVQPNIFNTVVESNKANLLSFYAKNLMPLISATNLTNDDVFNFAFNKYLPVNKENNQGISISKNDKGEQIIEVTNADFAGLPLNVATFAQKYGLNKNQQKEFNQILEKYSSKIASAVLVNDKNAVAVNASLWSYHDELRKELLSYVSHANSSAFKQMMPEGCDEIVSASEKSEPTRESSPAASYYYYISPDTFFASALPVNMRAIDESIKQIKYAEAVHKVNSGEKEIQQRVIMNTQASISNELKRVKVELKELARAGRETGNLAHQIQIFTDSGKCRVVIPKFATGLKIDTRLDDIAERLDSAFSSFKVHTYAYSNDEKSPIPIPDPVFKKYGNPVQVNSGSRSLPQVNAKPNVDSVASRYNLYFDNSGSYLKNKKKQNGAAVIAIDSLQKLLHYYLGDSIAMRNNGNAGTGLEEVRKEMEQVRKELEKFRKEMQQKKPANKDTILEAKNILEL